MERGLCGGLVGLDDPAPFCCWTNKLPMTSDRGLGGCGNEDGGVAMWDRDFDGFKTALKFLPALEFSYFRGSSTTAGTTLVGGTIILGGLAGGVSATSGLSVLGRGGGGFHTLSASPFGSEKLRVRVGVDSISLSSTLGLRLNFSLRFSM